MQRPEKDRQETSDSTDNRYLLEELLSAERLADFRLDLLAGYRAFAAPTVIFPGWIG